VRLPSKVAGVNRSHLRRLTDRRVREAGILLANRQWSGAYYVAGYAVERALKACVARQTRQYDFPDKKVVSASHTHDLDRLVGIAGLRHALDVHIAASPPFAVNWAVAKDWRVESRYEFHGSRRARDLFNAVTDPRDGVLQWLRRHW
jgi:hypothetical protein